MFTGCIIQARSTSTRLPNKALLKLNRRPVISWVVNRVKAVNIIEQDLIDEIIVAVPKGDKIAKWCKTHKVLCFEGSENDVIDRFYQCAVTYRLERIVRITADCPFLSPVMLAALIKNSEGINYQALAFNNKTIPGGWDAEIFSFELLQHTWQTAKEREHVTKEMRRPFQDDLDYGTDLKFDFSLELNTKDDLRRLREYGRLL